MSPEILNESGHESAADWWAFGIVLYELATGRPPFSSHDIEQVADDIRYEEIRMEDYFSPELSSLIQGLTQKDPNARLGNPTKGGVGQIKTHPFFKKVDWGEVYRKEMKPPIIPEKRKGVLTNDEVNQLKLLEQNF